MNKQQCEECLFAYKYLPRKMLELEIELSSKFPRTPGSVLKMVGRPVAKTPMDSSQTEQWGIYRATCRQAEELSAKRWLRQVLTDYQHDVTPTEKEILYWRYGKELPDARAIDKSGIPRRTYFRVKKQMLDNLARLLVEIGLDRYYDLAVR